jgi:hypothetical protein
MDWFRQNAQNVIFLHFLACVPFAVSYSLILTSTFKVLISHLFCSGMGHNHYAKEIQRNGLLFGSSSDTGLFNFHSISSNDYASCLCHSIFNAF